jgi:hypothetical protein
MFRSLLLLLCGALLSGCAALDLKRPLADDDLSATRRVGVVSALGTTFHGISIGTTVFNNTHFSAQVPEWGVDSLVVTKALAVLQTQRRFEAVALDRSALSDEQLRADQGKLLWEAAARQGVDRLVIVSPGVSSNYPHYQPSYGFFERSMFGSGRRCVYAAYTVQVYDVATHQSLAWEWGGPQPCNIGADNPLPFKDKFEDYSAEEKQQLRSRLEARLDESLRYAMDKLAVAPGTARAK